MTTITTKDGTQSSTRIGARASRSCSRMAGRSSADAWDDQMLFFGQQGFRVSRMTAAPWPFRPDLGRQQHGPYADDLAELIEELDLKNIVMVGHSTGGGEVAHYIGRHGTSRVAKVVLVGAVPPLDAEDRGEPGRHAARGVRRHPQGHAGDRSQFFKDLTMPFYGFNRDGAKVNEGLRESFWLQGMQGGIKGQYDCIQEFSEVDYTEDLKKIDMPTLVIHGDDDQIVPIEASAEKTAKIVKGAQLKVYPGAPHGLAQTECDKFNADVLAFIKA